MELALALALANFANVFLLVLNSQFARDGKVFLAFLISWVISVAQFMSIRLIATADDPWTMFLAMAIGSSLGVSLSIVFYRWLKPKIMKGKDNGST